MQNTNSSGYDFVNRVSYEPNFLGKIKTGFHVLGRAGNVIGVSGDECKEGRTSCMASDNNPFTKKERDVRAQHNESMGAEFNLLYEKFVNFGVGYLWKKQYRGKTIDRLNPNATPIYESDIKDKALYSWLGFGYSDFQIVFRGETGRGANGVLIPTTRGDSSRFTKKSIFIEYTYSDTIRFSIGGSELVNFDKDGSISKDYIDYLGDPSTKVAYENQFNTGVNQGIVPHSNRDKQLFIRSTIDF